MPKCHDLILQIIDTADAIIARAAAIPIGENPVYSLEIALTDAAERLRQIETDLDNLTEDDYRDEQDNHD